MCFYYDSSDAGRETYRKARKHHSCDGCKHGIKPGDHYWYISCLYDGTWGNIKECEICRYHRSLIYAVEVSNGCTINESWVAIQDLKFEMEERGWYVPGVTNETWKPKDGKRSVVRTLA